MSVFRRVICNKQGGHHTLALARLCDAINSAPQVPFLFASGTGANSRFGLGSDFLWHVGEHSVYFADHLTWLARDHRLQTEPSTQIE